MGDEIVRFGSINSGNFQNMQAVASVVQHSKGVRYTYILINRIKTMQSSLKGLSTHHIYLLPYFFLFKDYTVFILHHACIRQA